MANDTLQFTAAQSGSLKKITGQLGGLERVLGRIAGKVTALMAGVSLAGYLYDAAKATDRLDDKLSALHRALSRLRSALGEAVAPILEAVLPAITDLVYALARGVERIFKLIRLVFGLDDTADKAAQGQDALADATKRSAKEARRSLASFDQLNRLQDKLATATEGDSPAPQKPDTPKPIELDLFEYLFIGNLQQMIRALQDLDFSKLTEPLERISLALQPLAGQVCQGLQWAYWNVFLPMSQWAVETLLPLVLEAIGAALEAISATVDACRPALTYLWENFFKPLGKWVADALVEGLGWIIEKLEQLTLWMEYNQVPVEWLIDAAGAILSVVLLINGALAVFSGNTNSGSGAVTLLAAALVALKAPIDLVSGLITLLSGTLDRLSDGWERVQAGSSAVTQGLRTQWQQLVNWFQTSVIGPLSNHFRSLVNRIIGFFNSMLQGITNGLNKIISGLNSIHVSIPDWVPEFGGTEFGLNIPSIRSPSIPLLAQGAVLPANRPFLAVVGDQRHGTNIEAPLATIQEAVALVLDDMAAGQAAGQEAVVNLLGQILEAVLGITIGDREIAMAVDRYRSRQAVITGSI